MKAAQLLLELVKVYRDDATQVVHESPATVMWSNVMGVEAPDTDAQVFPDWQGLSYLRLAKPEGGCYVRISYEALLRRWKAYLDAVDADSALFVSRN